MLPSQVATPTPATPTADRGGSTAVRTFAVTMLTAMFMLPPSMAFGDVTGRVTLATAQMFRGLKETQDGAAVNGLLQYESDAGLYAAMWVGRDDYAYSNQGSDVEVDYIAGFSRALDARVSFDTSIVRYTYPMSNLNYDWTEWYASVRVDACCTLGASIGHDWLGANKTTEMVEFTVRYPLPLGVIVDGTAGYQNVSSAVGRDYTYYEFGLGYALQRFQFRIAWVSTDSAAREVFGPAASTRWVGAVSWNI